MTITFALGEKTLGELWSINNKVYSSNLDPPLIHTAGAL